MCETVARLQTPPGRGGIAVIELLGADTERILEAVFRPLHAHRGAGENHLQLGWLMGDEGPVDQTVVYRRRDRAEINIHGGPHVARTALAMLQQHGATVAAADVASPDTFARSHPDWDNPAVGEEMLRALPLARSELAARVITRQWSAGISRLARTLLRQVGTGGEESDLQAAGGECLAAGEALAVTHRLLHPAEVVLAGPPNVGKSTLANALVGRHVSIVHDRAGTTRDWVRELATLDGVPVWVTDTAGLWLVPEGVDAEAVRRAHARAQQADVVVLVSAETYVDLPAWWQADKVLHVAGKCDVCVPSGPHDLAVSGATGEGIDRLGAAIRSLLGLATIDPDAPMAFTHRQADLVARAGKACLAGDRTAAVRTLRELLG